MRAALPEREGVREAVPRKAFAPGDQVTVLGFNDNVFTLAPRSKDQAARVKAIDLMRAWGGTALYDVVLKGLNLLGRHPGRRVDAALQRRRRPVQPRHARGCHRARRRAATRPST